MKRRNFLKDIAMMVAISLLPKILQPSTFEVEEEMVSIDFVLADSYFVTGYDPYTSSYTIIEEGEEKPTRIATIQLKKSSYEKLISEYKFRNT